MKDENGVMVQSVVRALDILCLFQQAEELGISEIAREMGLGKSTAYGLVNSLVSRAFLEQSVTSKKYRLGIRNFELGRCTQQRMNLRGEAAPLIKELLLPYHETVHLAAHFQGEGVFLETFPLLGAAALSTQAGQRFPMHCSGMGKAMLAYLPEEYLRRHIFNRPLKALTPYTITDPGALAEELALARRCGYAVDNQESELGLRCIGAPILDFRGQVSAAVSVCGPVYRMDEQRMQQIASSLVQCARLISRRMGYKAG